MLPCDLIINEKFEKNMANENDEENKNKMDNILLFDELRSDSTKCENQIINNNDILDGKGQVKGQGNLNSDFTPKKNNCNKYILFSL
jgi:hypothetical protein